MPVRVTCPKCKTVYQLADALTGKKVRCKGCQHIFSVGVPSSRRQVAPPYSVAPSADIPNVIPVLPVVSQQEQMPPPLPVPVVPVESGSATNAGRRDAVLDSNGFDIAQVPENLLYPNRPNWEEVLQHPDTSVYYRSVGKALLWLFGFVAGAILLLAIGFVLFLIFFIVGGIIMLLGLLCLIAIPFQIKDLFNRSPRLVLAQEGIIDKTEDRNHFTAWLRVKEMERLQTDIALILVDAKGNEWDREIHLDTLKADPKEIAEKMEQFVKKARQEFVDSCKESTEVKA